MDQCLNPHQHLAVIGNIKDNDICLACAAIGLSIKPNHDADFYTDQLAELSDAVHAYYIDLLEATLHRQSRAGHTARYH